MLDGKSKYLGRHNNEDDAAKAYDEGIIKYGLQEYAVFNFPMVSYE